MARITMRNAQTESFAQVFELYISAVTARGVKDKTLATYRQHFHAISKRLDVSIPIHQPSSSVLDKMILQMRKEGLSDSSINSFTRTLKCFLYCNIFNDDIIENHEQRSPLIRYNKLRKLKMEKK